jgi:hypothetical protein
MVDVWTQAEAKFFGAPELAKKPQGNNHHVPVTTASEPQAEPTKLALLVASLFCSAP